MKPRIADWAQALRVAARSLRRAPGYASTTILTIALGIAANVIVFSVARAVLMRPLPYAHSDALYLLTSTHSSPDGAPRDFPLSDVEFLRWRAQSRTLNIGALLTQPASLTGRGDPETISVGEASASLFSVLGVSAELGRPFDVSEDVPHGLVAVVSHGFWVSHMGGRATAVGETIGINGEAHVVVGVMPAGFEPLTEHADAWVPFGVDEGHPRVPAVARVITVVARARVGMTAQQVNSELVVLSDALTAELPTIHTGWTAKATPLHEALVSTARPTIVALLALVGFLLLLICANVANLALARLTARRGESSVRLVLGGGAWQLLQPALSEMAIIVVTAGALGLAIGAFSIQPLTALDHGATPLLATAGVDAPVLAFTVLIAVVAGVLSLGIPAVRGVFAASGLQAIRMGGATRMRRERMVGRLLMMVQIALALVLVTGATTMVLDLASLTRVSPGFDANGITAVTVTLPPERYADHSARALFVQAISDRARALPGVSAMSAVANPFLPGESRVTSLMISGRPATPSDAIMANYRRVGGSYLATMHIPLLRGRDIDANDRAGTVPVALVSRSFARKYWPGEDAVGKQITRTGAPSTPMTVVGIADDVRDAGLGESVALMIYVPYAQLSAVNPSSVTFVVRSALPMASVEQAIAGAVHETDPLLPVDRVASVAELMAGSLSAQRFRSLLLGIIAALGLALAGIGIYGVTSYMVTERNREVGIRLALGASPGDVMRLLLAEALVWISGGLASGFAATFALSRIALSTLNSPIEVTVVLCVGVATFVFIIAGVAVAVPALRASRVPPVVALRS